MRRKKKEARRKKKEGKIREKEKMNNKIEKFTDLIAWQEGHRLVLLVYKITKNFPREELFGLVSQMRRCVVSITSNIAEGFGRRTLKDKNQFYNISAGSIVELQNQLLISRDLGYTSVSDFSLAAEKTILIHKLVNGLIKGNNLKMKDDEELRRKK